MKTYRICPCHSYDLEGIQTWLEELAASGLHLSGRVPGFLRFEKSTPRKSRYRLEPNPNTFNRYRRTQTDLRYLAGEFGWEFVLRYGAFDIYRTDDSEAPELNTDPRVQAITLNALKQERTNRLLLLAMHFLISLFLYPSVRYFFLNAVLIGPVYVCTVCLLFLWVFLILAVDLWWIHHAQQKLLLGGDLSCQPHRKHLAVLHVSMRTIPVVLLPILLALLCTGFVGTNRDIPLSDHPGDPPFITYADLAETGDFQHIETGVIALNGYTTWDQALAPVNYRWRELGNFSDEPGVARSLTVDYHKTTSEWFARGLAEDYYRQAKHSGQSFIQYYAGFDYPDLGVDYYQVYHVGLSHYVLLQHGNTVIRADISYQGNDDTLWLRWAEAMAQQLLNIENPDA